MNALPCYIERSNNRTSRATLRNGKILIRLARGLSKIEEKRHIENLFQRMTAAAARQRKRTMIDPFRALLEMNEGEHTIPLVTGASFKCTMAKSPLLHTRATPDGDGWKIARSESENCKTFHRLLWKLLSISAVKEMQTLVEKINAETYNESIRSINLKYMRSRWGSCSLGQKITLSTPLLFTSPEILRYVIIHELAHIQHPNHSKKFWDAVEKHDPHFRTFRLQLRNMSIPES